MQLHPYRLYPPGYKNAFHKSPRSRWFRYVKLSDVQLYVNTHHNQDYWGESRLSTPRQPRMVFLHIMEKLSQLSLMNTATKQDQTNLLNFTESLWIPLESFCCKEISAVKARWRVSPSQSITVPSKILQKFSAVLYPYGTGSNFHLTQEKSSTASVPGKIGYPRKTVFVAGFREAWS